MLVKIGNKIINLTNVNSMTYTEANAAQSKLSVLLVMFQRNQMDDTNANLTLKGEEANTLWAKAQTLLAE